MEVTIYGATALNPTLSGNEHNKTVKTNYFDHINIMAQRTVNQLKMTCNSTSTMYCFSTGLQILVSLQFN